VAGSRRLSQAIAEGDGISVLVEVRDAAAARAAEEQGAEGLVLRSPVGGVREGSGLPLLLYAPVADQADGVEVDAVVLAAADEHEELARRFDEASERGVECVVRVRDDEDVERVLEALDPEIFLLTADEADDGEEQLERLLELLPDIPAGKLAIAELPGATPDEVDELERAGVDAVLVTAADVAALVGESPPDV
jgi:indole-3-glycerol phosphate synthase